MERCKICGNENINECGHARKTTGNKSASVMGSAALVSEIPENWFITKVDLDAEIPYCITEDANFASGEQPKKLLIHEQLAYYLRRHFCGSKEMQEALVDRGRWEVRSQIKAALGIE
jgi:hypothetical protein